MKLTDLEYDDVVTRIPSDGSCHLKFHPKGPVLQRDVVKIWLNKLPVLCKHAAERPNAVTTLIDANAGSSMLPWANTAAQQLQRGKLGVPRMTYSLGIGLRVSGFRLYTPHGFTPLKLRSETIFPHDCFWGFL